jgi:glycosyltransferase involved in cell wall biosynthesis
LRLINAFASLSNEERSSAKLVLVGGRGWYDDQIVHRASSTTDVTWMGFQSAASCAELLRTCRAFVYVSEEEGFGLPVLDALRVGAPVLASSIPSICEVAGDAALYCDPLSEASIAAGIVRILAEGDVRRTDGIRQSDTFTWNTTAARVLDACRSFVDNQHRS